MIKAKETAAGSSRLSDDHTDHMDSAKAQDYAQGEEDEFDGTEDGSDEGEGAELYEEGADEEPDYIEADETLQKGKAPANMSYKTMPAVRSSKPSWADLDLSIIVAFVSPIGNWLTGGDHIKNLFLIILLIFYLHQLIEVPWRLYQSSLPRKPAQAPRKDTDNADSRLQALAQTELRKHEILYLTLAVISPLVGAAFLQHVATALGGVHALSWFSTTLFVLATGLRPWSHLITRLEKRTHALHTAVHYPPQSETEDKAVLESHEQALNKALDRLAIVEKQLADLRGKVARGERLQSVCDDLSEALGDLERGAKRTERRADTTRGELFVRFAALEAGLIQLEERRRKDAEELRASLAGLPARYALAYARLRSWLRKAVAVVLDILQKILSLGAADLELEKPVVSPPHHANGHPAVILHTHRESPAATKRSPRLATIPEAEPSDADSDGTYVSDVDGQDRSRSRGRSSGSAKRPSLKVVTAPQARTYGDTGFELAQRVVLWPYRASVRVLVALVPPMQKVVPVL